MNSATLVAVSGLKYTGNRKWQFKLVCIWTGIRHLRTLCASEANSLFADFISAGIANIAIMNKLLASALSGNKGNLLALTAGTVVSQLIPFAISPILTRLYTPSQFSVLELVLRITALFVIISTLRFDVAIPLPKEDGKALGLFFMAVISTLIVSFISLVLFIVLKSPITDYVNNASFDDWLLYIPVLILFSGISQCATNTLLRFAKFGYISLAKITDSFIAGFGKIIYAALLSATITGLILPNFAGAFFLAAIPLVIVFRLWKKRGVQLDIRNLKSLFREFDAFPKVNLPNAVIDVLQLSVLVILLSHFFGSAALGLYALNIRILRTPVILIGNSAGQIFYRTSSVMYANGESIKMLFRKYYIYLGLGGLIMFTPIAIAGPWIFSFVFGQSWEISGKLAQITAPWMFFNFLASALSFLPVVVKKQKTVLLLSILNFALIILALVAGSTIFENFLHTITLLAFLETAYFIGVNIWYFKIAITNEPVAE